MKKSFPPDSDRYPPPSYRTFNPARNPNFRTRCRPRQLPPPRLQGPSVPTPPISHKFTVLLLPISVGGFRIRDVETLVSDLNPSPESPAFYVSGPVAARLFYREWVHTRAAVVSLWRSRLDEAHFFTAFIQSNVLLPSDKSELYQCLKSLFCDHINALIDGDSVKKWDRAVEEKSHEIATVSEKLKGKRNSLREFNDLTDQMKELQKECEMLSKRVNEFRSAMRCLLRYLEREEPNKEEKDEQGASEVNLDVFCFTGELKWERVHRFILRECRRLEDALPIYAHRQEILRIIHSEQVMVLIGETGSGKSTQLVQFLVDSDIAANGSIVCTQPRKIAAISLANRVREESLECYDDDSIICSQIFSSAQQFTSKVIYMTDHNLLLHYMNDRNLSDISCIVVDEAHERSLNTDLLLALIKDLLDRRQDLRLVIMSATANANQLSHYFFGCQIFHVVGRNFPVEIRYVPSYNEEACASGMVASYVIDVVRISVEVHKKEKDGAILAFLTSQMEVEWACNNFKAPSAIALPLHGKLSYEDQFRIFQNFPGKRKVIFATNIAETSLTIPGVKYVIDSGMVKESKFEPGSGINVLRVGWISQSSANQRAGRAGRTEPGVCYRLYTECDFDLLPSNQEPEIRRVHLGVAVLRILALGIKNVQGFDFIDAPSPKAIEMALRNLVQLGAIQQKNGVFELTEDGRCLVKLGIEPRLGKLILSCFDHHMGKEGIVLAAVMANASSIFCRVGNDDDKLKADRLKVQFCHRNGDLFTLLSVYREWEGLPADRKNRWCWDNSINAKSMRRCQDTVRELELCLHRELSVVIPSYWVWSLHKSTGYDKCLKKIILSSLSENVAMYSGYDQLGYQVALNEQHVQLHPSCSLLMFSQKPNWVVFGELLSITNQYLVCVTAFDGEDLPTLNPPPLFDVSKMESQKLQVKVMTGFGKTLLRKFCGRSNHSLMSLVARIRSAVMHERIGVEVKVDQNEIMIFAPSQDMENVLALVTEVLEFERKLLDNECIEKCVHHGSGGSPVALFGGGALIKHLELEKRFLTVDIFHSNINAIDDKQLLMFLEKYASGSICSIHKSNSNVQDSDEKERWGKITFLTPDAAMKASRVNEIEFAGCVLRVFPSRTALGSDHKISFPAVRAKACWPRRQSKGFAIVKCDLDDVGSMVVDFSGLVIGGNSVRCEISRKYVGSVVINGIGKELSDAEILAVLTKATDKRILDFFVVRGDAIENPPCDACEEALLKEISRFMPKKNLHTNCCRVQVFPPEPKDAFMKALITFDGRLHLEAATALEQLDGKVLPGCVSWQKIKCQHVFHSSLSCPSSVYPVIKKPLNSLLASFKQIKGANCSLEKNDNGSYRVRISANATKTVAELRRPVEALMNGRTINDPGLSPAVLQDLFSRHGIHLMKSIQQETKTYILFDRHSLKVRIFGSLDNTALAEKRLIQSLVSYHEGKPLEVHLRGEGLPPDLMKQVVKKLGPDLHVLKEKVPGAEFTLSTRRHVISIHGDKEMKQKVEEIVFEIAKTSISSAERSDSEIACHICLCNVEDGYQLEGCLHMFCRSCLVEQCESAIRNLDSFPVCCAHEGCKAPILLTDLKSLLPSEKIEELFRASLGAFVIASGGRYRFCPTPDCPAVYRVAEEGTLGETFVCGACYMETCTRCHLEYHPYISCEKYLEFKEDPDLSLKEWCKGKEHVKTCPVCGFTIEKVEGCNHVECRCGKHVCWVCLEFFNGSDECYGHLRSVHLTFI